MTSRELISDIVLVTTKLESWYIKLCDRILHRDLELNVKHSVWDLDVDLGLGLGGLDYNTDDEQYNILIHEFLDISYSPFFAQNI